MHSTLELSGLRNEHVWSADEMGLVQGRRLGWVLYRGSLRMEGVGWGEVLV